MVDFGSTGELGTLWCTICDSSFCSCNDELNDAPITLYEDQDPLEYLEETEQRALELHSSQEFIQEEDKTETHPPSESRAVSKPPLLVSKLIEEVVVEETPSKLKIREEGEARKPYERFREKQFICDLCDQSFTLKQNVQQHIMAFHGLECTEFDEDIAERRRKRFKCTKCEKVFIYLEAAQRHEQKAHKVLVKVEKTMHKCDYCEKVYPNKTQLTEHVSIIHLNERNYVCDQCGTSFGRRGGLRRHIKMVHMGETFDCPYEGCDHPGYKCSKALAAHIRSVHTGDRPFSCLLCDRSFVRKNDLKVHERTHDRIEEKICEKCGSVFKREHYLKKHLRTCDRKAPVLQRSNRDDVDYKPRLSKRKIVVVDSTPRRIMPSRGTKRRRVD